LSPSRCQRRAIGYHHTISDTAVLVVDMKMMQQKMDAELTSAADCVG
jgi:hypothetical protein